MSAWRQPRTLADFGGVEGLKPAERKLLDERDTGLWVIVGDGNLPPDDAPECRRVRASFLRWLILGAEGAEGQTHEKGVRVQGAFIESDGPEGAETRGLDLENCSLAHFIELERCRFRDRPLLRDVRMPGLNLRGCRMPGLSANGLITSADLQISDNFKSYGEINLGGARIGGDLVCTGAKLHNADGKALRAEGSETTGNVLLGVGFESDGEVRLFDARIGGNLVCLEAKLRNADGTALNARGARIEGALFLLGVAAVEGLVDLQTAEIGTLHGDPASWPAKIRLDRCVYDSFSGLEWTAEERIAWLDRQDPNMGFRPQPWEQCAKVLRESGHLADARAVLIAKEKRQRKARRERASRWARPWLWAADALLGVTVRYGRQPLLAFAWLLGFWLLGAAVFGQAAATGAIKPNQPFVLRSPEWMLCGVDAGTRLYVPSLQKIAEGRRAPGQSQFACWRAAPEARQYPPFDPWVYSADALLPFVSFEMQGFWLPDETASGFGAWARRYLWAHVVAGWGLALLAVAGFSGLVKSD